jgi:hypothetical protein
LTASDLVAVHVDRLTDLTTIKAAEREKIGLENSSETLKTKKKKKDFFFPGAKSCSVRVRLIEECYCDCSTIVYKSCINVDMNSSSSSTDRSRKKTKKKKKKKKKKIFFFVAFFFFFFLLCAEIEGIKVNTKRRRSDSGLTLAIGLVVNGVLLRLDLLGDELGNLLVNALVRRVRVARLGIKDIGHFEMVILVVVVVAVVVAVRAAGGTGGENGQQKRTGENHR